MHTIAMLIPLLVGVWVFLDARSRGKDNYQAFLWGLGTFLLLIFVLPLWLLLRPALTNSPASDNAFKARTEKLTSKQADYFCSHCQTSIEGVKEPRFCPYCGQRMNQHNTPVITIEPDQHE